MASLEYVGWIKETLEVNFGKFQKFYLFFAIGWWKIMEVQMQR
jgi:hypothetical protein